MKKIKIKLDEWDVLPTKRTAEEIAKQKEHDRLMSESDEWKELVKIETEIAKYFHEDEEILEVPIKWNGNDF